MAFWKIAQPVSILHIKFVLFKMVFALFVTVKVERWRYCSFLVNWRFAVLQVSWHNRHVLLAAPCSAVLQGLAAVVLSLCSTWCSNWPRAPGGAYWPLDTALDSTPLCRMDLYTLISHCLSKTTEIAFFLLVSLFPEQTHSYTRMSRICNCIDDPELWSKSVHWTQRLLETALTSATHSLWTGGRLETCQHQHGSYHHVQFSMRTCVQS